MKTKKFIYTVGVSCSGKTTWVEEFLKEGNNGVSYVNINRDNIRGFLFTGGDINWKEYKFTKDREKRVTEVQHYLIKDAVDKGKNIILSDTNLNPKYIENFKTWDCLKGYEFIEKVFHVDLLEALERDLETNLPLYKDYSWDKDYINWQKIDKESRGEVITKAYKHQYLPNVKIIHSEVNCEYKGNLNWYNKQRLEGEWIDE